MRTTLIAAAAVLAATAVQAQPVEYKLDPTHTAAVFEIDHFGASTNRVRFDKESGSVHFDKAGKAGKVDITVDVTSVSSGVAGFDKHLLSADIFNAEKFPTARFVSEQFVYEGDKLKEVKGALTMLGQTHPLTLSSTKFGCYDHPRLKREVCGGDFEATIDRTVWGVNFGVDWGATKQVRLVLTVEAVKQ